MKSDNTVPFQIDRLDHVAFYVKDMEASANWYKRVLGLQRYQPAEWGSFPIFMLAGKTGLALFPASADAKPFEAGSRYVCMEHFAFHVSNEDFRKAREHYESLGLKYSFQDHHYFHSVYTKDPDGHTVELTTLVVNEEDFY